MRRITELKASLIRRYKASGSEDYKKQAIFLRSELTARQAIKRVADRNNCHGLFSRHFWQAIDFNSTPSRIRVCRDLLIQRRPAAYLRIASALKIHPIRLLFCRRFCVFRCLDLWCYWYIASQEVVASSTRRTNISARTTRTQVFVNRLAKRR
jgi:hypothetical protein